VKKFFSAIIILALILVGYYFYQRPKNNIITYEELQKMKQSKSLPKEENVPLTLKAEGNTSVAEKHTDSAVKKVYETKDDKFEAFDRMEQAWLKNVQGLLSAKEYLAYEELRNLNEKEKAEAYKAYHDYLRSKYGNNFKYNISEDQSIREKKINEKYLKDLLKLVGEEKFKKYLKLKDQYNENLRRESKSKSFLVIEF